MNHDYYILRTIKDIFVNKNVLRCDYEYYVRLSPARGRGFGNDRQ